jgi:hypothetical protein
MDGWCMAVVKRVEGCILVSGLGDGAPFGDGCGIGRKEYESVVLLPLPVPEHRAEIQLNTEPMPHPKSRKFQWLPTRDTNRRRSKLLSPLNPGSLLDVPASACLIGTRGIFSGELTRRHLRESGQRGR